MLYVSTRNRADAYTAYRALHENFAPDGGQFVPFQLTAFSNDEIEGFKEKSFGETVAQILNLFFSVRLNSWDVDFCIGRNPLKLVSLGRRTIVGEVWRNPDSAYAYIERSLYHKMSGSMKEPTDWARIAIRIAILFGIYGELAGLGVDSFDITLAARDFSMPMAALYAGQMGLPVGTIICSCNENGAPWDLIHKGEFNTGATVIKTEFPELDIAHPVGLERLMFAILGENGVAKYLNVSAKKGVYHLDNEDAQSALNQELYACVVGTQRIDSVIRSVYRTNAYMMAPYAAFAYGALQDYRAGTGENRTTLLLAENSPVLFAQRIANAIGVPEKEFMNQLNTPKE